MTLGDPLGATVGSNVCPLGALEGAAMGIRVGAGVGTCVGGKDGASLGNRVMP